MREINALSKLMDRYQVDSASGYGEQIGTVVANIKGIVKFESLRVRIQEVKQAIGGGFIEKA
jgi:hypothetical protein